MAETESFATRPRCQHPSIYGSKGRGGVVAELIEEESLTKRLQQLYQLLMMLTTLKQHPDPRDWAAFTLIGESD
ncbi:hypothetical protein [Coleofasciculus sp. H7-2]|uniref:hypothetical protein n=1 Tax=Coleofasciculus sp. H7-2 TaxID=3351545 RepID=UPI003670617A